jgi:hypothetical protein
LCSGMTAHRGCLGFGEGGAGVVFRAERAGGGRGGPSLMGSGRALGRGRRCRLETVY